MATILPSDALPGEPVHEVHAEGYILQAGPPGISAPQAVALAGAVADRRLPGGWHIEPVGRGTRDVLVRPAGGGSIDTATAWETVARLGADRDVASVEPVFRQPGLQPTPSALELLDTLRDEEDRTVSSAPADHQWSMKLCRIPRAWELPVPDVAGRHFGEGILIGHPDTGYTRHKEIWQDGAGPSRVLAERGHDFVSGKSDPRDPLVGAAWDFPGHGTATASALVGAAGEVFGAAPAATLLPLRVAETVVHLSFAALTAAIYRAIDEGCHVISMSLGGPFPSPALHRAIQKATESGIILFAAAGNYWPFVLYPARWPEVIAVAACNARRQMWRWSTRGPAVDVTAPGEAVWVASTSNRASLEGARPASGTSFAAATVAGVCALWLAHHGRDRLIERYGQANLAAVFKEMLLQHGVDGEGWDTARCGAGILNAEKLLSAPLPATPPAGGAASLASSLQPSRRNDLDGILDFLPGASPREVRSRLVTLLDTTDEDLPVLLADHGRELSFHAAFDPAFAAALGAPRRAHRGGLAAPRTRAEMVASLGSSTWLATAASPRLRRSLRI